MPLSLDSLYLRCSGLNSNVSARGIVIESLNAVPGFVETIHLLHVRKYIFSGVRL